MAIMRNTLDLEHKVRASHFLSTLVAHIQPGITESAVGVESSETYREPCSADMSNDSLGIAKTYIYDESRFVSHDDPMIYDGFHLTSICCIPHVWIGSLDGISGYFAQVEWDGSYRKYGTNDLGHVQPYMIEQNARIQSEITTAVIGGSAVHGELNLEKAIRLSAELFLYEKQRPDVQLSDDLRTRFFNYLVDIRDNLYASGMTPYEEHFVIEGVRAKLRIETPENAMTWYLSHGLGGGLFFDATHLVELIDDADTKTKLIDRVVKAYTHRMYDALPDSGYSLSAIPRRFSLRFKSERTYSIYEPFSERFFRFRIQSSNEMEPRDVYSKIILTSHSRKHPHIESAPIELMIYS
jgi:hypothetical protein